MQIVTPLPLVKLKQSVSSEPNQSSTLLIRFVDQVQLLVMLWYPLSLSLSSLLSSLLSPVLSLSLSFSLTFPPSPLFHSLPFWPLHLLFSSNHRNTTNRLLQSRNGGENNTKRACRDRTSSLYSQHHQTHAKLFSCIVFAERRTENPSHFKQCNTGECDWLIKHQETTLERVFNKLLCFF